MSRQEIETLQKQFEEALVGGSQNGDLSVARDLQARIDKKISEERESHSLIRSFKVAVNYNSSLASLIKLGGYDFKNPYINAKNFLSNETGHWQLKINLIHFNHETTSKKVIRDMKKGNLRPATIKELLSLGIYHPDLQREYPIVALGTTWCNDGGYLRVPHLYGDVASRELDISFFDFDWTPEWRFAAVRR